MSLLSGLKFSKNSSTKASPASTADAPESTTQQTTLHGMIDYNQGAVGLSKATGGLRGVFIPNESQPSLSKREPCNSNNTSLKRPSDGKRMPIGRGMSDKQVLSRFKCSVQDSIQNQEMGLSKEDMNEACISSEKHQFSALYEVEERSSTSESKLKKGLGGSNVNLMNDSKHYKKSTNMEGPGPTCNPTTSASLTLESTVVTSPPSELVNRSTSSITTELDANASAAQALRARLSGRKRSQGTKLNETNKDEVEIVTPHVQDIRLRAVGCGHDPKRYRENETQNATTAFLRKEIAMGPQDMDEVFTRNLLKMGNRYKGSSKALRSDGLQDEDTQIDTRMYEDRSSKLTEFEASRQRVEMAKREHAKSEATEKCCPLCVSSRSMFRRDIVASMGQKAMLLVETKHAIVKGHCILAPMMHSESMVSCDEDVLHEIETYKRCLLQIAEKHGQSMVFMETAPRRILGGHAHLECVPIPAKDAHNVPLFFRQALSEAGEEWSTHKLIKFGSGGIRKAVPSKGFAYFSVEWPAYDGRHAGGYAHIIEDQRHWSKSFGRDTIGAVLKRDRLASSIPQSVQEFQEMWAPYDDKNSNN